MRISYVIAHRTAIECAHIESRVRMNIIIVVWLNDVEYTHSGMSLLTQKTQKHQTQTKPAQQWQQWQTAEPVRTESTEKKLLKLLLQLFCEHVKAVKRSNRREDGTRDTFRIARDQPNCNVIVQI